MKNLIKLLRHRDAPILATICLLVVTTVLVFRPLPVTSSINDSNTFSAYRALEHLHFISGKPHPVGSVAWSETRKYIIRILQSFGLQPTVSPEISAVQFGPRTYAAETHNIVAKIEGKDGNLKPIVLLAHYDSTPQSYGANDDGAGVVTLLETARILQAEANKKAFKRSIYFLFTDAEEMGLLGANLLANTSLGKNAFVALNFEARGNTGPVMMFQSSPQDLALIQTLATETSLPIASSLVSSLVKLLPNDTDLTPFLNKGVLGLNFAYADGILHYHTPLDHIAFTNPDSIQHHGDYALHLARSFANRTENLNSNYSAVFFNLLPGQLIYYPDFLSWLLLLATIYFLLQYYRKIKIIDSAATANKTGVLLRPLFLFSVCMIISLLFRWISGLFLPDEALLYANKTLFMALFSLLLALFVWFVRDTSKNELLLGFFAFTFFWGFCAVMFLPGTSYIFLFPLLIGLPIFLFCEGRAISPKIRTLLNLIYLIPVSMLFTSTIYIMQVFDSGRNPIIPAFFSFFAFVFLLPLLCEFHRNTRQRLAISGFIVSLGLTVFAFVFLRNSDTVPMLSSLNYYEHGQDAFWTTNKEEKFIFKNVTSEFLPLEPPFGIVRDRKLVRVQTKPMGYIAPKVEILSKQTLSDQRNIFRLNITTFNNHYCFHAWFIYDEVTISGLKINGVEPTKFVRFGKNLDRYAFKYLFGSDKDSVLDVTYCGNPSKGVELEFIASKTNNVLLNLYSYRYGFSTDLNPPARPSKIIPSRHSEKVMVGTTIDL